MWLHIGEMVNDRIVIEEETTWQVFAIQAGKKILLASATSKAQAKRYAKEAEIDFGLKKKKKEKMPDRIRKRPAAG
jgi:hypothetical protein